MKQKKDANGTPLKNPPGEKPYLKAKPRIRRERKTQHHPAQKNAKEGNQGDLALGTPLIETNIQSVSENGSRGDGGRNPGGKREVHLKKQKELCFETGGETFGQKPRKSKGEMGQRGKNPRTAKAQRKKSSKIVGGATQS